MTVTTNRIHEIADLADVSYYDARRLLVDYDWPEGEEHLAWVAVAPAREVANWLLERIEDEEA